MGSGQELRSGSAPALTSEDRKRGRKSLLRESEERFRLIVDTVPGLVCTLNAAGEVELLNRQVLEYFGKTKEELKNWALSNACRFHPDDLPLRSKPGGTRWKTGQPYVLELRQRRVDGVYRWFQSRALPMRDTEDRIVRWYKLSTDVDDRKKAEEALRTSQAELAHVTRVMSMGELTASIAHEVNKPLAAVVTLNGHACLRWLNRETPDLTEEVRAAVERMIHSGIRGSEVIARIRAFVKKEPPVRDGLDVNNVIHEIATMAQMQIDGSTLRFDLAQILPRVLADRIQLQQVLLNLIGNGLDAMKAVTDRPRVLCIRTSAHEADGVSVAVEDAGTGIDPAQFDRLFETFYTTKPDGLGLGLSISRSIIESHGEYAPLGGAECRSRHDVSLHSPHGKTRRGVKAATDGPAAAMKAIVFVVEDGA